MSTRTNRLLVLASMIALLTLGSAVGYGQDVEKDLTINLLRKQVAAQKKLMEALREQADAQRGADARRARIEANLQAVGDGSRLPITVGDRRAQIMQLRQLNNDLTEELKSFHELRELDLKVSKLRNEVEAIAFRVPNPPTAQMDGKIEKARGALARISLCQADGLTEDQTLYVYRPGATPNRVAMLRVFMVGLEHSFAKVVPGENGETPAVQDGDFVSSRKLPAEKK